MAKWSEDANEFTVRIAYDKHGRAKATIPATITRELGRPDTLTFVLSAGAIIAKFDRDIDNQSTQDLPNETQYQDDVRYETR